jgi:hypothetical protein
MDDDLNEKINGINAMKEKSDQENSIFKSNIKIRTLTPDPSVKHDLTGD